MRTIELTNRDIDRIVVIEKYLAKDIPTQAHAAGILNISTRQFRRLVKRYKKCGNIGVVHKSRGKPSNRKLPPNIVEQIKQIIHKDVFHDFGPTLLNEKLSQMYQIYISTETLRQIMIEEGLWKPKQKRKNKQFINRPRKEYEGELVQFDGSYHDWLETGKDYCLLLSIDDATGKVKKAKIALNEGKKAVFSFWKEYALEHGMPKNIYLDRFATYKNNQYKDASYEPDLPTEFEKICNKLGTKLIKAKTPQAKGRIERANRVFQDRFIKECRLRGIKNPEEANKFLEEEYIDMYNKKFAILPAKKLDLHRNLTKEEIEDIDWIFSQTHTRKVRNDYTIQFEKKYIQLYKKEINLYPRLEVEIKKQFNGKIKILLRGKEIEYKILEEKPLYIRRKEISKQELKIQERKRKERKIEKLRESKKRQIRYRINRLIGIKKGLYGDRLHRYAIGKTKSD